MIFTYDREYIITRIVINRYSIKTPIELSIFPTTPLKDAYLSALSLGSDFKNITITYCERCYRYSRPHKILIITDLDKLKEHLMMEELRK